MMNDTRTLFDTHVHLDRLPKGLDPRLEAEQARHAGVGRFLVPGVDPRDWLKLLTVVATVPDALAAPGAHPLAADRWCSATAARLESLLDRKGVVAIGEIGLDGTPGMPPAASQERALRKQIRMAAGAGLPVILHCRKATGRLLEILRQEEARRIGGIWHGFSGSIETARAAMDMGFGLAFGGPLTWPGARRAPQVLKALPADRIVLESDAPDQAPAPYRGQTNRPRYLSLIAQRVGALRDWTPEQTAHITTTNALRLLKFA
jgi:TatD DNase family protein